MKIKYITILVLAVFLGSCTSKFEEFNTDTKRPATVTGEALFSNAQKALADQISTPNVNLDVFNLFAQYWTETTYTDEANYDIVNRTIADNTFQVYYRDVLRDFKEAAKIIKDETVNAQNTDQDVKNKEAIVKLMMAYTYQHLVDIFGNIPYTEALDINNITPGYTDAKQIYVDMIDSVNNALANLVATENGGFGTADLIYSGDVASWIKFGNSLKIKLGITIADADAALAKTTIESAVSGAFSSSADNALFPYQTTAPNTNQIYAELVLTGRHDFVAANTIVDIMNGLNDPRRAAYFTLADTSTDPSVQKLAYLGGAYGESDAYPQYSHVADAIQLPDFPGYLLTYDEVLFYLAEAAARGMNVGTTADTLYNNAITASFELWKTDSAAEYIATSGVAYNAAKWKEMIGTQSWLAFYTRGQEGYTQWRRLDYPIFNVAPTILDQTEIPVRFTYPIGEQTLNPDNYAKASAAIGGDKLTTKLFWDINNVTLP
jgi:hypothetical protein